MKQPKIRYQHFVPSIADILFLTIFLFLSIAGSKMLLGDGDTGYHIRAGEYILKTFSVPHSDIFSYLTPALPWTAHEWLSEIVMALIHRAAGLSGVAIFFAAIIASVYFLLFKIIRSYKGNILVSIFIMLLVILSSQIHWLARPHIFSLLIIVLWYYLLDLYEYSDRNYLYLLPPVMLLWVNLHGGFIIGLVLNGIYLTGNVVRTARETGKEKESSSKKIRTLGLITFACFLATVINPYGYHILLFPFRLTSNKFIMDHIIEFISPNFHDPMLFFKYFLLFMMIIFAISKKRLNITELMLTVLFTYMSLYSVRYIPLFSIIMAIILVKQTDSIVNESDSKILAFIKRRAERIDSVDAVARGHLWLFAAVLLAIIGLMNGKLVHRFDEETMPVAAVEFLQKEHISGNMFNNDEFGDYIIYAAWPEYKVFFDGRSDMYGAERIKEYYKVARIEPGWQDILKKYDIKWVIYNDKSTLSQFLLQRDDWRLIYADKVANIFIKNIPENLVWLEKYRNIKPVDK
jgi:hypothetical protein